MELKIPDRTRIASIVFEQEPDSCEACEDYQQLSVSVDDAGGGHFCRLSTERWSVDDPEELAAMLKQLAEHSDAWQEEVFKRLDNG